MAIPLDLSVIGMLGIILLIGRAVHAGRFRARARAELRKESGGVDLSTMRAGFPAHPDDYHGGLLGAVPLMLIGCTRLNDSGAN